MRLYRARGHTRYLGDAFHRLSLHQLQCDAEPFLALQQLQTFVYVHAQAAVGLSGADIAHARGYVTRGFVSAAMVGQHVAGYAVELGGEARLAAEAAYMGVGFDECLLGEVVAELPVAERLAQEEAAHRLLMLSDKGVESSLVAKSRYPGRQRYVA